MDRLKTISFDEVLWALIRSASSHQSMDKDKPRSLSKLAELRVSKGFKDCNKNKVDRALTRLEEQNKIERRWNGHYYITKALLKVYVKEQTNDNSNAWINRKQRPAPPIAYKIYNYFKVNGVGLQQALLSNTAMSKMATLFNVTERTFRLHIENIVFDIYLLSNGKVFDRLIYGDTRNGGYYMISNDDEANRMLAELDLELYTISMKRSIVRRKLGYDNQTNMTFSDFETTYRKSISNDLN